MTCLRLPLALTMLLACAPGWTQSHSKNVGPYALRSSTVVTNTISADTARAHGIERSPKRALLNVTVLKHGNNIPAKVDVQVRNLSGLSRPIPVTATTSGEYVSYTGVYDFVHGEVLDFTINATPQDSQSTLTLTYRDRMWGPGDLPDRAVR